MIQINTCSVLQNNAKLIFWNGNINGHAHQYNRVPLAPHSHQLVASDFFTFPHWMSGKWYHSAFLVLWLIIGLSIFPRFIYDFSSVKWWSMPYGDFSIECLFFSLLRILFIIWLLLGILSTADIFLSFHSEMGSWDEQFKFTKLILQSSLPIYLYR